jgi:hypothetical protein
MPERAYRPRNEVIKQPPEDNADLCLLCERVIEPDNLAVRTHGV